jgi:hypothetical protein
VTELPPEDRPECEHYWVDHCYDGLSVRLCWLCHEPDWADVRRQMNEAAAAERERIYAELGNDHHVIFTEDRWTVEHSAECRLSGQMPECAYHAAVALVADLPLPNMAGRWRITGIDSSGLPILTPADPIRPTS